MAYPPEIKKEVYYAYLRGESKKNIIAKYKINKSTVCLWVHSWETQSITEMPMEERGTSATRILELENEKQQLKYELEIIHKSGLLQQVPKNVRIEHADSLAHEASATLVCQALELSTAALYHKRRHQTTARDQRYDEICAHVLNIYEESQQRFGSEKIRVCLKNLGYSVGKKKIIALMKELNIFHREKSQVEYQMNSAIEQGDKSTYVSIL